MSSKHLINSNVRKISGNTRAGFRKSSYCLLLGGAAILLIGAMFFHSLYRGRADASGIRDTAGVVAKLELTDLCLFNEARYTRHPSQADFYSAFQDHPTALEHFPTGSIAGPQESLRRFYEQLD
jgi:hypothetical protein